ncbi:serine hydrolase [Pleionea sp. CnH1-48]|uniref:serine hydrolase domain-containing protein n=1 Tax=Pleionea sp. CnH1-48 TaxID=2954494 RepID=UPI0020973919|nr:serine hydrolase [Pleionea sp. CnH1-48]MCO7223518.1 beta-lactamase family protein [Pleionea sp. CnH1-48]
MKFAYIIVNLFILWSSLSLAANQNSIEASVLKIKSGAYTGIDGLLVYKEGKLTNEYYFNGFDAKKLHQTRSTFKSVTGLLAAIAFDKQLLKPDELIVPLISRYMKLENIDPDKAKIKVSDLLNMTSGLDCSEMPGTGPYHDEQVDNGSNPLKYSLSIAMSGQPGKKWKYCNANSFLLGVALSAALERAKQGNINEFAKEQLFAPLGISDYRIYQSPEGFLYAQGNARFKPKDLMKLGLLVLNKGKWQGKTIISNRHIDSILNGVVDTHWSWTDLIKKDPKHKARYAYQWYRTLFDYGNKMVPVAHTWGNGGQFVFVAPDLNLVVVFTGSNYGDIKKQKQAFEIMKKYIIPAV